MDSLIELRDDLETVQNFSTLWEIKKANQADVYINYCSLKCKASYKINSKCKAFLTIK